MSVFDTLEHVGDVAQTIRKAAIEILEGKNEATIKREAYGAVVAQVRTALGRGTAAVDSGSTAAEQTPAQEEQVVGQFDLFSGAAPSSPAVSTEAVEEPVAESKILRPPGPAPAQSIDADLKQFGQDVQAAVDAAPDATFKTGKPMQNKVFIHDAYDAYSAEHPGMTLQEFKTDLNKARQKGYVGLTRADLVQALDPASVALSKMAHTIGGKEAATFNFIRKSKKAGPDMTSPEAGAADLSALADMLRVGKDKINSLQWVKRLKIFMRRFFAASANMPASAFKLKEVMDGWTNADVKEASLAVSDLINALHQFVEDYRQDPQMMANLREYFEEGDPAAAANLPAGYRSEAVALRKLTDKHSLAIADLLEARGKVWLAEVLRYNQGKWIRQSYLAFIDKSYKPAAEDVAAVRELFEKENALRKKPLTPQKLQGRIDELISRGPRALEARNPVEYVFKGSPVGGLNKASLKKRNYKLKQQVKNLWGEIKDPVVAMAMSANYVAHYVNSERFLANLAATGLAQEFLFDAPTTTNDGTQYVYRMGKNPKTDAGTDTLGPLSNLYGTEEFRESLWHTMEPGPTGWVGQWYAWANGVVKWSKAPGSIMGHERNFTANALIAVANGHHHVQYMPEAFKIVLAGLDVSSKTGRQKARRQKLKLTKMAKTLLRAGEVTKEQYRDAMAELDSIERDPAVKAKYRDRNLALTRRGVLGESVRGGEAKELAKGIFGQETPITGTDAIAKTKRGLQRVTGAVTTAYQAEDDVWKAYGFLNEWHERSVIQTGEAPTAQDDYIDIDGEPNEIADEAAACVRQTYPTFSLAPRAIQWLRKFPLSGVFVTFPWAMHRATVGIAAQAVKECKGMPEPSYKSATTEKQRKAAKENWETENKRLRARGTKRGIGLGMAMFGPLALGIASGIRAGRDEEEQDAARSFMAPWTGRPIWITKHTYIDFGFTDPFNYQKEVVASLMKGKPELESWDRAQEALWAAAEPFFGEELLAGRIMDVKRNKRKGGGRIYNESLGKWHMFAKGGPHIGEAFVPGTVTSLKRVATKGQPGIELLAMFSGFRITKFNKKTISESLKWDAVNYMRFMRGASKSEPRRKYYFGKMAKIVADAQTLGLSNAEIAKAMQGEGSVISAESVQALLRNQYRPRVPKKASRARKRPGRRGSGSR